MAVRKTNIVDLLVYFPNFIEVVIYPKARNISPHADDGLVHCLTETVLRKSAFSLRFIRHKEIVGFVSDR